MFLSYIVLDLVPRSLSPRNLGTWLVQFQLLFLYKFSWGTLILKNNWETTWNSIFMLEQMIKFGKPARHGAPAWRFSIGNYFRLALGICSSAPLVVSERKSIYRGILSSWLIFINIFLNRWIALSLKMG